MAYVLKQFNQIPTDDAAAIPMSFISGGKAGRVKSALDVGVTADGGEGFTFQDEALLLTGTDASFEVNKNYYLHTKILRLNTEMVFDVYLSIEKLDGVDGSTEIESEMNKQFLKTIQVASATESNQWADFEIVFSPLIKANAVVFKLRRIISDFDQDEVRHPRFCYLELSSLGNLIGTGSITGGELVKIGVQSRPGFIMCINGEEIRVGRTGVYELRNGVIVVNFFSVVVPSEDIIDEANTITYNGEEYYSFSNLLSAISSREFVEVVEGLDTPSFSLVDRVDKKTRFLDAFTFDYMYKTKEEEGE